MVNGNTNLSSESLGELGFFNLSEGESSSELDLGSILLSLSLDEWSELTDWIWESGGSLSGSGLGSYLLVSHFVEETLDRLVSKIIVFPQMRALNDIIVFYHVAY